jgi:hypothetical protein
MDSIELTDEQKFAILEEKRIRRNELIMAAYHRRTAEGRNTRTIPKELHKPRGRKPTIKTLEELEKTSLKLSSKMGRRPGPQKKREPMPETIETISNLTPENS